MKIYSLKKIETPRTILRPLQIGDEIALNKCINHSLDSLQKWMPWAENPSLERTRNFVHTSVKDWEAKKGNSFPMVVIYKPTEEIIGASGFNEDSIIEKGIYTTGYWLDISYRGQGLVTEFLNGLTRFAFNYLTANALQLYINKNNLKSLAVANRLGFLPTPITSSVSNREENDIDILFTRVNTSLLPPLEVTWHIQKIYNLWI